jgi:hypothetical protein
MGHQDNYHAYLLRLWREDASAPWRASLQEAHAGQLVNFASVAQLIAFIEEQTRAAPKAFSSQQGNVAQKKNDKQ